MGAETEAARAEVLASRAALLEQGHRLQASARAAVDIPGNIKRQPAKTAGLVAGTAFVALGGPQRLFRRARRMVQGPKADLPKSMLPDQVEKQLRKLGTDGDKVRSVLEREFMHYLDERSKVRKQQDTALVGLAIAGNVLRPLSDRLGKQLAERLFSPDSAAFDQALAKVRARYGVATASHAADAVTDAAAHPDGSHKPGGPTGPGAPRR